LKKKNKRINIFSFAALCYAESIPHLMMTTFTQFYPILNILYFRPTTQPKPPHYQPFLFFNFHFFEILN